MRVLSANKILNIELKGDLRFDLAKFFMINKKNLLINLIEC